MGTEYKLPISDIEKLSDLGGLALVVLSACQTALGNRGSNGIEIENVGFSFLEKGANAVIASRWKVNDGSTSLLMQQFYKNLATGKMTKAEALRQAQLSLLHGTTASAHGRSRSGSDGTIVSIPVVGSTAVSTNRNYIHPYYCAPFILIGNSL